MAMFIVSYRKEAEGVCCTNIAVADNREAVEAKYVGCDFVAINPAKSYEVEELRQRGCPVVVCDAPMTASERCDRALEAVRWLLRNEDCRECGCDYTAVNIWDELEKVAEILEG